jgi:hypothetical protein
VPPTTPAEFGVVPSTPAELGDVLPPTELPVEAPNALVPSWLLNWLFGIGELVVGPISPGKRGVVGTVPTAPGGVGGVAKEGPVIELLNDGLAKEGLLVVPGAALLVPMAGLLVVPPAPDGAAIWACAGTAANATSAAAA